MRTGIIVEVSATDRQQLAAIVADRNTPQKHVWRAHIVLLTAEGVVARTLLDPPRETTHWTATAMARESGISISSVQRIWRRHGLRPHRVRQFKLSNDRQFASKLRDIVGLYVDPPAHAVVLSIDEKSQIQALDRTQRGLPMKKGRCGTMTHDYKRHGTTTLFAALNEAVTPFTVKTATAAAFYTTPEEPDIH
jgi:hypothetical protein